MLGLPDEAPSLVAARRSLLANQAHDSIGGCSQDEVHRQMAGRYATATELAGETTQRVLERLAGLERDRRLPWTTELDLAVFNPSPVTRTDVVRMALDGFPLYGVTYNDVDVHPLALAAGTVSGYEVDGQPARLVRSEDPGRVRMVEDLPALDVEFVATDVPAFGWRRVHLVPSGPHHDDVDDGRAIDDGGGLHVRADDDGTLTVEYAGRRLVGLCALEDRGDRGDTYDFDPVDGDPGAELRSVHVERHRHASGIHRLLVTRVLAVPAAVDASRSARSPETVLCTVRVEARLAPGTGRLDLHVDVDNEARDYRLRMLFPTGGAVEQFHAATTFGVSVRTTGRTEADGWWHPPPETFPHQGWIEANGLVVVAPGLPEAEVTSDGTIAVTLLRAVGWLSHLELGRRPIPAGPTLITPDAQCPGGIVADLSIRLMADGDTDPGAVAALAAADELGLRAVGAGEGNTAPLPPDLPLVRLTPESLVCSAMKPAEDGDGFVIRLLNAGDEAAEARLDFGFPLGTAESVRLDELPDRGAVDVEGDHLTLPIGPHALRSVRIRTEPG